MQSLESFKVGAIEAFQRIRLIWDHAYVLLDHERRQLPAYSLIFSFNSKV